MLFVSAHTLLLATVAALALNVALLVWVCRLWLDYERNAAELDALDAQVGSLERDVIAISGHPASGESGGRRD